MKYEFRLEIECNAEEAEWMKDYLLDMGEIDNGDDTPKILEVTYDIKEEKN